MTSVSELSELHMTPFEIGQVKAHMEHDLGATEIARRVFKADGKNTWTRGAVQTVMEKIRTQKKWRGERKEGSGAQRKTTAAVDKKIEKEVMRYRGKKKVTVKYIKRAVPAVRNLGKGLVASRLHDIGLAKLRRRKKVIVPGKEHKAARLVYAAAVKRMRDSTLKKWAYTDGMSYYLGTTEEDQHSKTRAALGQYVWRMEDGSDAMYEDCIGPSAYKKCQGKPVKVWGLLAGGVLYCHILPDGQNINGEYYAGLVRRYFPDWKGKCEFLVQDFEKALHRDISLDAIRDVGLQLVKGFCKYSQDLNAIENAWGLLRQRTDVTTPMGRTPETRKAFVARLRNAIRYINVNYGGYLRYICNNQKERADDVEEQEGGRTEW